MFWRSLRVQKSYNLWQLLFWSTVCSATLTSLPPSGLRDHLDSEARHLHVFRASSLSDERPQNAVLYTPAQRLVIQIVALVMGGLSLFGSSVTLYWFIRMKRLFRHQLIMMLIVANIVRSLWYFVFPITAFTDNVMTQSSFCQASGFITQLGVEMADISVLFIAIHTALQVFKPKPPEIGQSGLARYRYLVFVLFVVLPLISASIPFARGQHSAYVYQGPTCSLPVRPFWYRLGLSWIPRYAIMLTILCLYIAIYVHAGFVMSLQNNALHLHKLRSNNGWFRRRDPGPAPQFHVPVEPHHREETARPQTPDTERGRRHEQEHERVWSNACSPLSSPTRGSRQQFDQNAIAGVEASPRKSSDLYTGSAASTMFSSKKHPDSINQEHINQSIDSQLRVPQNDIRHFSPFRTESALETADMRRRRNSIKRHLRLLFIYPMVYFAVWTIPFVMNVLNYDNYYAQHPIFAITLLSYLAVSSMGLIDSIVFALREKPWRHIPGSNGTFYGSFFCWGQRDCCSPPNGDSTQATSLELSARRGSNMVQANTSQTRSTGSEAYDTTAARPADRPHQETSRFDGVADWDFAQIVTPASGPDRVGVPCRPLSLNTESQVSQNTLGASSPKRPEVLRAHTTHNTRNWFDDL